jgi:hypothetical protein
MLVGMTLVLLYFYARFAMAMHERDTDGVIGYAIAMVFTAFFITQLI